MKRHDRILLPINIGRCPLEVFAFVNGLAGGHEATVTLLHVVNGMARPGDSLEGSLRLAQKHLELLARRFIDPALSLRFCVRTGNPVQEILAEITLSKIDLIVLTSHKAVPGSKRPYRSEIVETLAGAATCRVSFLSVRTWFNCEEQWEVVDEIVAALDYVGLLKL